MLTHWLLDFGRNVEESLDRPASNFDVAGNFLHFNLSFYSYSFYRSIID